MKDLIPKVTQPVVDPDKLVGGAFLTEHAGVAQKMEVKSKEDGKTMWSMQMEMRTTLHMRNS